MRDDGFGVFDLPEPPLLPAGIWLAEQGSTATLRFSRCTGRRVDIRTANVSGHLEVACSPTRPLDGAVWIDLAQPLDGRGHSRSRRLWSRVFDDGRNGEVRLRICDGSASAAGRWTGAGVLTLGGITDAVRLIGPTRLDGDPAADTYRCRVSARVDRRDFGLDTGRRTAAHRLCLIVDLQLMRIGH